MTVTDLVMMGPELDPMERARQLAETFASTGERSPHTRDAYRLDITGCSAPLGKCRHGSPADHLAVAWLPWCAARSVNPLDWIRTATVQAWLSDLGGNEHSRARRLSAVSSWYRWLVREGTVPRNPCDLDPRERPKTSAQGQAESTTVVPSMAEVEAILAAADADDNPCAAPLCALLTFTGARLAELLAADTDAIRWQQGHPLLHIVGKGRKERDLPLVQPVYERVEAHLNGRRKPTDRLPALAAGARAVEPLLVGLNGRRLTRPTVASLLTRLARKAGIGPVAEQITPHSLRHAYATDLLAEGVPVRDVQYAMGHADPRTTERYDRGRLDPARHPTYRRAAQLRIANPVAPVM